METLFHPFPHRPEWYQHDHAENRLTLTLLFAENPGNSTLMALEDKLAQF